MGRPNISGVDAVHLEKIHPRLYLCSKRGSKAVSGQNVANITVAGEATVGFLRHHPSGYRAYVIAGDTMLMGYGEFVEVFEKGSDLLRKALKKGYHTMLSCYAGINRSVTTILMYVIRYTDKDWEQMRDYIRDMNKRYRRLPALTNPTFERYLHRYAKQYAKLHDR